MTHSPPSSKPGSTSSTPRSTTARSGGRKTRQTTSRSKPRPLSFEDIKDEFERALKESERR